MPPIQTYCESRNLIEFFIYKSFPLRKAFPRQCPNGAFRCKHHLAERQSSRTAVICPQIKSGTSSSGLPATTFTLLHGTTSQVGDPLQPPAMLVEGTSLFRHEPCPFFAAFIPSP